MELSYFKDTDTLYIELGSADVAETRDLDENTLVNVDSAGQIVAITVEHASTRTDVRNLSVYGIAA